jgi:subtilisin family serine protease
MFRKKVVNVIASILLLSLAVPLNGNGVSATSSNDSNANIKKSSKDFNSVINIKEDRNTKKKNSIFSSQRNGKINEDSYKKDEIIVKYKNVKGIGTLDNVTKQIGLKTTKIYKSTGAELVKVPKGKSVKEIINKLKDSNLVEYAEPNYKRYTNAIGDPFYSELWGLKNSGQPIEGYTGKSGIDIKAETAWAKSKGSTNMVIAVLDTGIDINHPDLKNNIWKNTKEIAGDGIDNDRNGYIDDVNGWDFYWRDRTVFDNPSEDSHGTHVSGTIAASANTLGVIGVAPNVKIMPLKIMGSNGGYDSDAILAIEYAKSKGVKIFNMSWGGAGFSNALYDAMKSSNALFVTAAGNNAVNNDSSTSASYPASFDLPNILSVAAIDNKGNLASFSAYGPKSVDVAAPGTSILSTLPKSYSQTDYSNAYAYGDGTSMAAPHVTGTAALVSSSNPGYTVSQIRTAILKTTAPLSSLAGKIYTGGLINASKAVNYSFDNDIPGLPLTGTQVTGTLNETTDIDDVYSIKLLKGERVTLNLTGDAGTDFDLYLYDKTASTVKTNAGILAYSEKTGLSSESITFKAPAAGTYYIDLYGFEGKGTYKLSAIFGAPSAFYESTASELAYSGSWTKESNSNSSAGSYHSSNKSGSNMQFVFNGTGIRLSALKDSLQGYVKVTVDGTSKLINLNSSSKEYNSIIFEKTGLSSGRHILKIEWTGQTGSKSNKAATAMNFDTITVFGGISSYVIEENHNTLKKSGTWETSKSSTYSGGSAMYSGTAGRSVELAFTGNGIKVLASKALNRGLFDVYIDGKFVKSINTYSSNTIRKAVVFEKTGLTSGSHRIKIVIKGQKSSRSKGTFVYLDAFIVGSSRQTIVQENKVSLKGKWLNKQLSKYSGGSTIYSSAGGDTSELTFTGRSVKVLGSKANNRGTADVYIDGKYINTINTYSSIPLYKAIIFESNNLSPGNHKIKIKVRGQKGSESFGTQIFLDAYLIS